MVGGADSSRNDLGYAAALIADGIPDLQFGDAQSKAYGCPLMGADGLFTDDADATLGWLTIWASAANSAIAASRS